MEGGRKGGRVACLRYVTEGKRERRGGGAEGKVSSAATAVQHKGEKNGEGVERESKRGSEREKRG